VKHDVLCESADRDIGRLYLETRLLYLAVEHVDIALEREAFPLKPRDDRIGLAYLRLELVQLALEFSAPLAGGFLSIREKRRDRYENEDRCGKRNKHQKRVPTSK
jgi:hypothetical protein